MTWATAGFIIAFLLSDVTQGWISNYHRPLTSNACGGEHLNRLESQHPNKCEDCVRNFECKIDSVSETCHWTDRNTKHHKPKNFTCEDDGLVPGLSIQHINHHEERIWHFECCSLSYQQSEGVGLLRYQFLSMTFDSRLN